MSKLLKGIIKDINITKTKLREHHLIRDENGVSQIRQKDNKISISYSGKGDDSSVVYDKHLTTGGIMDRLLFSQQYSILLYDKSIIQAEFVIQNEEVIKERLVFIKKHNKVWNNEEIEHAEIYDEDWFEEDSGTPIMLRVDYAPEDHIEGQHAAAHLTISNHDTCRIPMKGIVSFSIFIQFVLLHFYGIDIDLQTCSYNDSVTITELEKQMIHINWE